MNVDKGKFGEDLASEFLLAENFKILERNYRIQIGEIDIIAYKDEVIYAIEVKYRKRIAVDFHPYLTMNKLKINKMKCVIQNYLSKNTQFASFDISFCLIAIDEKSKVSFYSHLLN